MLIDSSYMMIREQKNLRLLAEKLAREKTAAGPGVMVLPTCQDLGVLAGRQYYCKCVCFCAPWRAGSADRSG